MDNKVNATPKPISMIVKDSKEDIVKAINNCNLHPAILELVMKDIYKEVLDASEKQRAYEESEYFNAMTNETTDEQ